jgi:PmbA protein
MSTINKLDLAQWVIEQTKKSGADEAAVAVTNERNVEFQYRDNKLETLKESTQNNLSLDIYLQKRYSSHSTSDLRREALAKLISEAVAATKYLSQDEYRDLPDPKYYQLDKKPELNILDNSYESIDAESRKKLAAEIEQLSMQGSDLIISTTAGYSDTIYETAQVHSNGFSGQIRGTYFSTGAEVTVRDGETGRPSDWFYATTRHFDDLPGPEQISKEAVKRALQKIGQSKIDSGQYTMIVENRAGRRLLGTLTAPMNARSIQQKSSYLDGMIGKKVASEIFTLIDDPFLNKGIGSRYFDGDGIAAHKRTMIENGILRAYYIDNYYGRKLNMEPNSGSQSNTVFLYGDLGLDDMIAQVEKGILVNGFIGGNSNGTTGDFSYGIVGQLIEKGKIVRSVNEMNVSGNAREFWNQLRAVGNDPYPYSSVRMPSLLFEDIQFSGV